MALFSMILKDHRRTWWGYGLLLCLLSGLYFGSLYDHLLDTHDADTFQDHLRIQQEGSFFFSPEKTQASGRPVAEAVKYLAFLLWGNHPGAFHLLGVAAHTLASLLWAWACWRLGLGLELSLLAGLLFLVNVAHFQAIHHISALDYPLALCWALLSLVCYLRAVRSGSWRWWAGFGCGVVLGLMTHLSSGMVVLFCLYWSWREGYRLKQVGRWLLPVGGVLIAVVGGILYLTSGQTSTWRSLELYSAQDLGTLLVGMVRVLLWLVSRLWTTAHWLGLPAYRQESWELYVGGMALVGLGWLIWKKHDPLSLGAVWILSALLPFLLLTEATIRDLPAGPSRYLYLTSAGSSLLWAWGVQQVGRWGRPLSLGGLAALLVFSFVSLKQTEAISFYTSGRNYIAHGQFEEGIAQLQRAIRHAPQVIPLEETYFRLICSLPYTGQDPQPLLREGLEQFPHSFWLSIAKGVLDTQSADPQVRTQGQSLLEELGQYAQQTGQYPLLARNASALYHNLGKGYLREREPLRAIQAFQRALEFEPDKASSLLELSGACALLGILLEEQGNNAEAMASYGKALELDPANTTAHVNLGWLLYAAGRWEEAIAHYQTALATAPSSHAQFNLGLAYLAKGELAAAQAVYAQAVEQFGAEEGGQIGAVGDLEALIAQGRATQTARDILRTHWPAGSR